jgi:hypothetical protein
MRPPALPGLFQVETVPVFQPHFDGATYEPARDHVVIQAFSRVVHACLVRTGSQHSQRK